jgi:arylsulfatase A-like enzyme
MVLAALGGRALASEPRSNRLETDALARAILADDELTVVLGRAESLLQTGLNAGSGYGEVWIRDLNTFIELALQATDRAVFRDALLRFFAFQGPEGDIVDGYIPKSKANVAYKYRSSELAPEFLAHKNTVETDQESSLVQAVRKYVEVTGDQTLLGEIVDGKSVKERLAWALEYVHRHRFDSKHGLVWGATTVDWGDVQPEHEWGVELDEHSHRALDIYDNAMFLIALDDYLKLLESDPEPTSSTRRWREIGKQLRDSVREHLWDSERRKFKPHVYLGASPFPEDFDEAEVSYHGGTAVGIEANLLSPEEVELALTQMRDNVHQAGASSIGLTVYPVYPAGTFKNPSMGPFSYQNGGDWCWFGGRMIQQLIRLGMIEEAYRELRPMVSRVIQHDGFYEWWSLDNQPRGSGLFRGSAGVLGLAIQQLRAWASDATSQAQPERHRPNMIFILSDDVAMGDLGCYGQQLIQTPHLDRMAAEGTRYLQAYTGTSVCAPARTSLMTGLHMGHSPVRANREIQPEGQMPLPAGTVTVAQLLKEAGYATACIGKWGMGMFDTTGSPLKMGFDHFYGYNCQRHAHSYFPTYLYDDDRRFELPGNDGKTVGETYAQELIADETLRWVRAHARGPFFLFYAATLPHGRFEIDDVGVYATRDWTPRQKNYAAMVTRLDRDVGRLLALLQELDIDENTLVMVSGDNGSSFNPQSEIGRLFDQSMQGKLRGFKRGMYEGALRQAAIARWPGRVPAGRVTAEPWAFWDFLPTAVELAGGSLPREFRPDGYSLVSFLQGGPAPRRDFFYWELHERQSIQAVRFGDWKGVRNGASMPIELYDLRVDVGETQDLSGDRPDLVARVEHLLQTVRTEDPNWPLRERRSRQNR